MKYAKIVVKSNYEKRGDLVLRSYVRALKKVGEKGFLDGDNAFIYGVIDDNNRFHELFTNEIIDYDNYVLVDVDEIFDAYYTRDEHYELLNKIMHKVLFDKNNNLDLEISTMEELAEDRSIEFDAYDSFLSRINPYMRLSSDNQELYNAYNNFLYKIEQIKIMKRIDQAKRDVDSYEVYDYLERPEEEIVEEEYLVFDVPQKTLRK